MAWVWPTELAWGELAVVHPPSAVFSGQPIMQSHTVTHHSVSESLPEGGERVRVRPIATALLSSGVFASVQSGGDSMAPLEEKASKKREVG